MSTIIECPACATRYKMNKAIPEGGRSVKCARCGHQWRVAPEEPEELAEALIEEEEHGEHGSTEEQPAAFAATAFAATADAGAEAEAHHKSDEAAAAPTVGDAWDLRRGHLAAAIASMGATPDSGAETEDETDADAEDALIQQVLAQHAIAQQPWQSGEAAPFQDYATAIGDTGPAGHEEAAAAAAAQEREEAAAQFHVPFDADADADEPPAWPSHPSWMTDAAADDEPRDGDPEASVREVFKAAMEDMEGSDASAFDRKGAISSVSRPVFTDSTSFEETLADVAAESAKAADDSPAGYSGFDQPRFPPSGHGVFIDETEAGGFRASEHAEFTGDGEADETGEDTEKFESDIVGIFRQQMHEKRSFGPSAGRKSASDGFTDYDNEFNSASEQGDDRYMADSPLDADAAALQAALEGSLRERRAEESAGGGLALAAAWAVFLSVLSGVTLAFISFRDELVVALPGTAALYRGIGLDVQDRQVDFGPVTYRWTTAEGKPMIEVTGRIINLTDREIAVPRVLVNVHDKESTDTVKATATVRSEPLAAHETADFTLEFLSPPKTISQIELAFADTE